MVVDDVIRGERQMNPPVRRKPLAQCFLFGMAGLVTGHAMDARAETLRVDPALLAPELRGTASGLAGDRASAAQARPVTTGPAVMAIPEQVSGPARAPESAQRRCSLKQTERSSTLNRDFPWKI